MNLFTTNKCPFRSATELHDDHVRKMILETAQIMDGGTRHLLTDLIPGTTWADYEIVKIPATQRDNPVILSARYRVVFEWCAEHLSGLLEEFKYRWGHEHSYAYNIQRALEERFNEVMGELRNGDKFRLAVASDIHPPGYYRLPECVCAHQINYARHKLRIGTKKPRPAMWTRRHPPIWLVASAKADLEVVTFNGVEKHWFERYTT